MNGGEWERRLCPECNASSMFYCARCLIPVGLKDTSSLKIPTITLPLPMDILFRDELKKSTAVQAAILAPNHINLIPYPGPLPEYYNIEDTVIIYPSNDSVSLFELPNLEKIKRVVFIDTPWQRAPFIVKDRFPGFTCVKLAAPPKHSNFWRYHNAGTGCVSTIEAIHLVALEYLQAFNGIITETEREHVGQMLFFFNLISNQIKKKVDVNVRPLPMDEGAKAIQRNRRKQDFMKNCQSTYEVAHIPLV